MSIEKISMERVAELSIESLSARPNNKGRFGVSGLSSRELRRAFDRLPLMALEKINELIDAINRLAEGGTDGSDDVVPDHTHEHDHDDRYVKISPNGSTALINGEEKINDIYLGNTPATKVIINAAKQYFTGAELDSVLCEIGVLLQGLDSALSEI